MTPSSPEPGAVVELPTDVPLLQQMVRELQAQVRELTERLSRNSDNSSQPPSSDKPWRQRQQKPRSERKRGAQPGHPGSHRRLVPEAQVAAVIPVQPVACDHCQHEFEEPSARGRHKIRRHQVTELPPICPVVNEYQLHRRRCKVCGKQTWATLPEGVSPRCVGPRLQALVALLTGACRLSRRPVQDLLRHLCGVELSLGTIAALEATTAQALEAAYAAVGQAVPAAPVLFVDETSWKEEGRLQWLWTATSADFAFYRLDPHRSQAACDALLGRSADRSACGALIISDRYSGYGHLPASQRSFCWAHLLREFRAALERGGLDGTVARWVMDLFGQILTAWRSFRAGALDRPMLLATIAPWQTSLQTPLNWGSQQGSRRLQVLCRALLAQWDLLWNWLHTDGAEPTNNAAERALRPAVLWRKSSFGHQSENGKRYVERMLTVVTTLRLQHRNLWEYLVEACDAAVHGRAGPSLLIEAPT